MSVESDTPVLFGPDGRSLSLAGELLAPNALNVSSVFQLPGKAYPFRWDEAMRDAPLNALAMRRDTFYLSLIQERTAPLVNLDWEVQPDDDSDPLLKLEADTMTRAWRELPDKPGLLTNLAAGGIWFGRVAQQGVWGRTPSGLTNWVAHEPVHGDNVQFSWDGCPIILVNKFTADRVKITDPAAVVSSSDRGAYGLRLYRPALRNRFVIHKHVREAADYFEGEMAGGVHGVGLRSWLYWGDYIRRDTLAAMLGFMNSVGMMDILVFNYPNGNAEAKANAIANAKKVTGKIALVMPRDPMKDFPAVEQISMNTAGVEVMQRLISEYFDKHAERLVVGQSMSAGADKDNGLGGTGRAEFAADTKFQLTKTDALRLGETLTNDWLKPCHGYNFPASKYGHRLKMVPILDDPKAETKVQNAGVLLQNGVKIEEEELRKAAGFREPREGKPTVGGQQPGQLPGGGDATNPNAPPGVGGESGRATTPKDDKDDFEGYSFDPNQPRDSEGRFTDGKATFRNKLPKVSARPKTKKARQELGKALADAWTEARNLLAEKYNTPEINDRMSEAERQAENDLHATLRGIESGTNWNGPRNLGELTEQEYLDLWKKATAALDKLQELGHQKPTAYQLLDRLETLIYKAAQPPFPGAVFDEQKRRWVKPEEASAPDKPKAASDDAGGGESGRATSPEQDAAAEAKAQANTLKRFGAKVVEKAKAVAERAFQIAVELSYHAQTMNIAEDIADTPWDMSKIINAKGTGDWLSTNLGISGGMAAGVGSKVLSYGLTKLKQFLAKRRAAKEADTTANQLDDFGSVVSYAEQPQHPTDRAELAAWIVGRLLAGIGVPEDKCPGKEAFAGQLADLSQFSLYAKEDAKGNLHGEGDGRFVAKGDSGKGKEGTDRPKA